MSGIFGARTRCRVIGKEMLGSKREARAALAAYGRKKGSNSIHWCIFCESYHMTKGVRGNRLGGK